jgi:hypothetical protein
VPSIGVRIPDPVNLEKSADGVVPVFSIGSGTVSAGGAVLEGGVLEGAVLAVLAVLAALRVLSALSALRVLVVLAVLAVLAVLRVLVVLSVLSVLSVPVAGPHLHMHGAHGGTLVFRMYLDISGFVHAVRSMYVSVSIFGSGQGGTLVFRMYLLRSGHKVGHGGGHVGQGGQ